ncbi:hypothetical protein HK100_005311, partial [Physocladia obscura]
MPLTTKPIPPNETLLALPLLLDTEESEQRVRATLLDPTCTVYAASERAGRGRR